VQLLNYRVKRFEFFFVELDGIDIALDLLRGRQIAAVLYRHINLHK